MYVYGAYLFFMLTINGGPIFQVQAHPHYRSSLQIYLCHNLLPGYYRKKSPLFPVLLFLLRSCMVWIAVLPSVQIIYVPLKLFRRVSSY